MTSEVTMEAAEVEGTLTLHQALSGSNGDSIFYPILYYMYFMFKFGHTVPRCICGGSEGGLRGWSSPCMTKGIYLSLRLSATYARLAGLQASGAVLPQSPISPQEQKDQACI